MYLNINQSKLKEVGAILYGKQRDKNCPEIQNVSQTCAFSLFTVKQKLS